MSPDVTWPRTEQPRPRSQSVLHDYIWRAGRSRLGLALRGAPRLIELHHSRWLRRLADAAFLRLEPGRDADPRTEHDTPARQRRGPRPRAAPRPRRRAAQDRPALADRAPRHR